MADGPCEHCINLKEKGKSVLARSVWHLIQLKHDGTCGVVYLCFQSRDGEVQLVTNFCPKCGRSYHGLGGILE